MEDIVSPVAAIIVLRYIVIGGLAVLIIWLFQRYVEPKTKIVEEKRQKEKPFEAHETVSQKSQKIRNELAALRKTLDTK
jgi:hypothetical protein